MTTKPFTILSIETSCDETAAAVIVDGRKILSNVIASSADLQAQFGGVVPEVAARQHVTTISQVIDQALAQANHTLDSIDAIAATYAPGLIGALLVGLNYGKTLAYATGKPFIPVHHIHGHIASNFLESDVKPPFVCLVVSGGHTQLVHVTDYNQYTILGQTGDDAVGEAYDKVARLLNLPYPGGPQVDKLATGTTPTITFPRAMAGDNLDFSYSGLKSAVINYINTAKMKGEPINPANVAASFQQAAIGVITDKTKKALVTAFGSCSGKQPTLHQTGTPTLAVCGGVACNSYLRTQLSELCESMGVHLHIPSPILCTDNGAMIGAAAYYQYLAQGGVSDLAYNARASVAIA